MKAANIFLSFLSLLIFSACDDEFFGIKGEGPVVEESRTVPEYQAIELAVPATVFLRQGPREEVRILAQENILNNLETYVQNGKLRIKFDKQVRKHDALTVYLSSPVINSLIVSGSGDIKSLNTLTAESLAVIISGSGKVDVAVDAAQLNTAVSGSGTSRYRGSAEEQIVTVSGSGGIQAFDLQSKRANVQVSGSGNVQLWTSEALEVRISGSGEVTYKGNPSINSHISGSGKIRAL